MKVIAIVQARMGSSRLPGKVLADIWEPLLRRVLDRLIPVSSSIDKLIVAITSEHQDDILEDWLIQENIDFIRGSTNDVLDRFVQAASPYNPDIVVRVTADDPFKDPVIVHQLIQKLKDDPSIDYASNTIIPSWPEGVDMEVLRYKILVQAHHEAVLKSDREHVTSFIINRPNRFKLFNLLSDRDLSRWRWTVDKPADLEFARLVYSKLRHQESFSYNDVVECIEDNPSMLEINSGTIRNEGYLKSSITTTQNDRIIQQSYFWQRIKVPSGSSQSEFRSSKGSAMMRRFERSFADRFGINYGVSFVNGTATMHAALEAKVWV